MGIIGNLTGNALGTLGTKLAPTHAASFVRAVLDKAIDGYGPLPGAAKSAQKALEAARGDREEAISELIESHVRLAGAQGFATNLGGLVTAAVTIPANITGLALIQSHLVAAIAYLRGHNLADTNVRNAVLACQLGKASVKKLVGDKKLPGTPFALATAAGLDPELNQRIGEMITAELLAGIGGKRMAIWMGKRIPLVGGAIGGASDGFGTWQIGRYAAKELRQVQKTIAETAVIQEYPEYQRP